MNTGTRDALQAAGRYIVVIVTAVIAIFGLFKAHDIAGLFTYVQSHGGELLAAISGLVSLGVAAYGVLKTHKRGVQATPVIAAQASNKK
jgi:hypothetical protein